MGKSCKRSGTLELDLAMPDISGHCFSNFFFPWDCFLQNCQTSGEDLWIPTNLNKKAFVIVIIGILFKKNVSSSLVLPTGVVSGWKNSWISGQQPNISCKKVKKQSEKQGDFGFDQNKAK